MTAVWVAIVPGAALGVAVACVVAALVRPAPIHLTAALNRLSQDDTAAGATRRSRAEQVLASLAARSARSSNRWWGIPAADLAVLDVTATRYLGRRARWAVGGAAFGAALAMLATAAGLGVPLGWSVPAALAGAVAAAMVPPLAVADDAATRREEFRSAVIAYLDLVAQERMAGRAAAQALSEAADVFDGWAFTRIRGTLAHAQRAGHLPWEALTRLADRMSSPELADVADIASTAADGAAVHATLTAKATGLRRAALATEKAAANTRSQRLTLPVTLLLLGFLLLVLYPAVIRLFTT